MIAAFAKETDFIWLELSGPPGSKEFIQTELEVGQNNSIMPLRHQDTKNSKALAMHRILLGLLLFPFFSHAQDSLDSDFNFKNPGDYNNYIMKEMITTAQKNFEYISFSVHSEEYDQLETKRKEVVGEIVKAKSHIQQMPPLDGDTRLRDEAVSVLDEYQNAFELDYQKIIGLKRKSRDSFESMEAYFEAQDRAEEKVNKGTKKLRNAQHVYAEKHNMNVVNNKSDDELEIKMNKVIAVNSYWRSLFLDYFKISKQYDRMWDVLPLQNANAIERERLQVVNVIDQVMPGLKSKTDFKGDREFRDQTINMAEYFLLVTTKEFKRIIEILNKKALEQKDIEEINGIISKCNADHERLTYNWNIAAQDLFRKNVDR